MAQSFRPEPAESVGFITNYRCTFQCKHCLYCSSPKIQEKIDESAIREIIDQIDHVLGKVFLHLGGGEPLIHFPLIKKVLSYLRKTRIIVEYLETNGSFLATDTISKLEALKNAGLDCLLLSISPFHNEFTPVREVKRMVHDIVSVFGQRGIFPWHPGFLRFLEKVSVEDTIPLETYFNVFSPSEILYQLTSVMYIHPGGRGAYLLAKHLPCHPPDVLLHEDCEASLRSSVHAHIDYNGNYLTGFCSGLRIGKQTGFDLNKLYKEGVILSHYPLLDILVNKGLKGLYELGRKEGYVPQPQGYVSPCHLCLDVRLHLYLHVDRYEELYPSFFYEDLRSLK